MPPEIGSSRSVRSCGSSFAASRRLFSSRNWRSTLWYARPRTAIIDGSISRTCTEDGSAATEKRYSAARTVARVLPAWVSHAQVGADGVDDVMATLIAVELCVSWSFDAVLHSLWKGGIVANTNVLVNGTRGTTCAGRPSTNVVKASRVHECDCAARRLSALHDASGEGELGAEDTVALERNGLREERRERTGRRK